MTLATAEKTFGELNPFGVLGAPFVVWADDTDLAVAGVQNFPIQAFGIPSTAADAGYLLDMPIGAAEFGRTKSKVANLIGGRGDFGNLGAGRPEPTKEAPEHGSILP